MKPKFSWQLMLTLITILSVFSISRVFAQNSYVYAYLNLSQSGDTAELNLINPAHPQVTSKILPFPIPDGWTISPRLGNLVSPDGRWVASVAIAKDQSKLMIYLYDMLLGTSRQLIEGFLVNDGNNISWSPDSRYLALNIQEASQTDVDLFIYTVATNSLADISKNTSNERDIGWSSDSNTVLTFTRSCALGQSCANQLELVDPTSGKLKASLDLSSLPLAGNTACDPTLSPDGRYSSLNSNCSELSIPFSTDFPNDVYLWNIGSNVFMPVTNIAGDLGGQIFRSSYHSEWVDAQTLLLGVNYAVGETPEQEQLSAYHVVDKTTEILSKTTGANFSINLRTGQIALQPHSVFATQPDAGQPSQVKLVPISQMNKSQIQPFDQAASVPVTSIPTACGIQWSPDSTTLAVTTSATNCQLFLDSVYFIDTAGKSTLGWQGTPMSDSANGYKIPLGWVQVTSG